VFGVTAEDVLTWLISIRTSALSLPCIFLSESKEGSANSCLMADVGDKPRYSKKL